MKIHTFWAGCSPPELLTAHVLVSRPVIIIRTISPQARLPHSTLDLFVIPHIDISPNDHAGDRNDENRRRCNQHIFLGILDERTLISN